MSGRPQVDIAAMLTSRKEAASISRGPELTKDDSTDPKQPSLLSGGTLKDYQLDGLEWLSTLFKNGLNGILADEMGLGKTIQCIAFLCFLVENGFHGPFLIVVPLSTLLNWKAEINRFAPALKVILYQGTKAERAAITPALLSTYNIVLTSYEISIRDFKTFNLVNWKYLIVDEGHRLKNSECLLIRALKSLNVTNRLLITGTPLQNNLNELWSLLNFILPDIFQDLDLFQQWFDFDDLPEDGNGNSNAAADQLNLHAKKRLVTNMHAILKPFLLRRLKKDVITNLPPKKEYLIRIPLTSVQRRLYRGALDRKLAASILNQYMAEYVENVHGPLFKTKADYQVLADFMKEKKSAPKLGTKRSKAQNYRESTTDDEFEDSGSDTDPVMVKRVSRMSRAQTQNKILRDLHAKISKEIKALSLQNPAMQLRNICNSPYLYYEPFDVDYEGLNPHHESLFFEAFTRNSPKVQVLDQICKQILDSQDGSQQNISKILIFSQFTRMLDLLQDWFEYEGRAVCRLDGSTSQAERDEEIATFNEGKDARVFLLSTRAGGLGINLTAADTVVLFDSDWNPQMDLQAIDRVHRIGQTKPVKVFRFVAKDSIEEILISKSMSKRFLEKLVIQLGEYKFNKLRGISKDSDTFDLSAKDVLEFSKLVYKPTATSNQDNEVDVTGQPKLAEGSMDSNFQLSDAEMHELLDRSPQCYSRVLDEHAFPNITSFETFNNYDRES